MKSHKKRGRKSTKDDSNPSMGVHVLEQSHRDNATFHTQPFPVVGIGASAGGLEAFVQLLSHVEPNTGMAFVLVQHLDPTHESLLSDILGRATTMKVLEVTDGMPIQQNHVYVMPQNVRISVHSNELRLTPRGLSTGGGQFPINEFFQSLARDYKDKAIGVILSGTGTDGTTGLSAISAAGGITFAQELSSAKFSGMPASAIESGINFIMTPSEIGLELSRLPHHFQKENSQENDEKSTAENNHISFPSIRDLQEILNLLLSKKGMDFSHYKSPTIRRRVHRRMTLHRFNHPKDYLKLLQSDALEMNQLYEDLLVKVTSFFRNPESFEALSKFVYPSIMAKLSRNAPVRIWVAGCATGEEAYSLAISLLEFMDQTNRSTRIELFATDISEMALTKARAGIYDANIKEHVSEARLNQFFIKEGQGYRIGPRVRECCVFATQNVARDPPFSRLDIISCRNLLIYLNPHVQKKILSAFHFGLIPNGFLTLGSSESIGNATDLFGVVDSANKIFVRKPILKRTTEHLHSGDPLIRNGDELLPFTRQRTESSKRLDLKMSADRAILAKFSPPGVIINENMDVMEVRGDTSPYLMIPQGELTSNLSKMCRPGLLAEFRHTIHAARTNKEHVRKEGWVKVTGNKKMPVVIDVIPFSESADSQIYFAVLFSTPSHRESSNIVHSAHETVETHRLERELLETKNYLNAIIESEQAKNEELKSASEEILSANEELQSTNEEMATAKEETQATNEELSTVNDELQNRNLELGQVNNDLANLFGSVQIPIVMLSENMIIRRFTHAAEKILNLSSSDIGKSLSEIAPRINLDQLPKLVHGVLESLNTIDQEIQDRDGKWYSLRIKPYRTFSNKIDGAVVALVDIDSLKKSEERMSAAIKLAETANQSKSDFLANMSHEIRTPLNVILGYSEILSNPNQSMVEVVHSAARIRNNVEHLTELIDDILDLAKVEAGKLEITKVKFSLLQELGETASLMRGRAESKQLDFRVVFDGEIPEQITACPKSFRQILFNIIGNALKFTDRGEIEIRINLIHPTLGCDDGMICILVKDTGCGLLPDQQSNLFQPFSQADNSVTRRFGGTGLGLMLARRLAEAHGGTVDILESTLGVGSTFRITLGCGPLDGIILLRNLTMESLERREKEISDCFTGNERLASANLLIVEDGLDNQALMGHFLTESGAKVDFANNGAEGVRMAKNKFYDVILMDIQMPILGGYQAVKILRESDYHLPIIALTAHAMQGEREKCLAWGFDNYLSKPVRPNILLNMVEKYLKPKNQSN